MTSAVSEVELAPNEKRCSKCKEVKDRGEFDKRSDRPSGVQSCCKNCKSLGRKKIIVRELLPEGMKRCSVCNKIKKTIEFSKNKRNVDGFEYDCKICCGQYTRNWKINNLKKYEGVTDDGLICPVCNGRFFNLLMHCDVQHGLSKSDLEKYSITKFSSNLSSKLRSIAAKRPNTKIRRGEIIELKRGRISLPKESWPLDCKYVRVIVDKHKLQIHFNPLITKIPKAKKLCETEFHDPTQHRLYLRVHDALLDSIEVVRPMFMLRNRAGFVMQFFDIDEPLLETFEYWSKSGASMVNTASLTIYRPKHTSPRISIADHLWPINAEYVYPEWHPSKRKNGYSYLDLLPISRTGFIIGKTKLNNKQYIGLTNCFKISRACNRLIFNPINFITDNGFTFSDWDLKEVLPSGALRFRLYKERQPKEQSEDIAS